MRVDEDPIIVEQNFNASIETVWNAITEVDQMQKWYFADILAFKPEIGFETQFIVQPGERSFNHMWEVTEVVPLKKISYNWKYDEYPGNSTVSFELYEENDSTILRLTHKVTENFPDDIPEFKKQSGLTGWTYFIKKSLKKYLEK